MSDSLSNWKILLQNNSNLNPNLNTNSSTNYNNYNSSDNYLSIIPSYMRNVNTILQAEKIITNMKWEVEGKRVKNKIDVFYL